MLDILQLTEDAEKFLKYADDLKELTNVSNAFRNLQDEIRAEVGSVINDCIPELMKIPSVEKWNFEYYKSQYKTVERVRVSFAIGFEMEQPFVNEWLYRKDTTFPIERKDLPLPMHITTAVIEYGKAHPNDKLPSDIVGVAHALLLYIVFENEIRRIEKTIKHWPQGFIPDAGETAVKSKRNAKIWNITTEQKNMIADVLYSNKPMKIDRFRDAVDVMKSLGISIPTHRQFTDTFRDKEGDKPVITKTDFSKVLYEKGFHSR